MFRHPRWMTFALVLLAGSLASPAAGQTTAALRSEITAANLSHLNVANAFDAVRALRPLWLRQRGTPMSLGNSVAVRVYLNDLPLGTVESLETIRLNAVVSIHHFGSIEAVRRWGPDHAGGVIHVRTL